MTLKPVRTLLLALALAHSAVLAATVDVDCVAEPEQEACCEMELDMPCFIKNMIRATDGCSVACKKKYQNLGWTCYNDSNMHWRWAFMQTNCDPLKVVEFTQPSTTLNAGYARSAIVGASGACGLCRQPLLLFFAFFTLLQGALHLGW
mmetsp:Transcript_75602/g.122079  ORF Transcript_75602/g.122079 Transcript_75602/m.122079 type:complete len:148 (-) Transcript_75602:369-812(-)